jgi:putative ABC transport system substrate-binding protein
MKEGNRQEASGNRRKVCVYAFALCSLLLACCSSAYGQRTKRIPGIGDIFVSGEPNAPGRFVEAFRQGLRDVGYTEGKNILVEYRYAAVPLERVPEFVNELVHLNVNVLVLSSSGATRLRSKQQAVFRLS